MLEISTLGGLSIQRDGQLVTGLATRKVEALLVYLACTGHPHPREVLAEMFWEERAQERSLSNLRVALTSLRKAAGDYLSITRETVSLDLGAEVQVDAARLEQHLAAAEFEAAVNLYRGEFLAGFSVRGCPAFDDWASLERERLGQAMLEALGLLVAAHLAAGSYAEGITHARHLLRLDPWQEDAHRWLMRLLAFSGQRGAALAQYETCREVLESELGIEPEEETTWLYEQIQAGELEAPPPAEPGPTEGQALSSDPAARGYELGEQIGAGGFGQVFRAFQPAIGREVAIKVILPQHAADPEFIRRFEGEARLVARLEHPHIVPLYDYWHGPDGAFLVMRWLPGGTLYETLKGGPWELRPATRLLEQIASALDLAHQQGVIHRDVKPENILFDDQHHAYLADFGIAKDLMRRTMVRTTGLTGSLLYLSPEQLQGQSATPQSDQYSLGVVLHELLRGEYPLDDTNPGFLLNQLLTESLPPLHEQRSDIPSAVDAVLQRATAKNPAQRYADVQTFAQAFAQAALGTAPQAPMMDQAAGPERAPVQQLPQIPAFLEEGQDVEPAPFVAREKELARLEGFLQAALGGQGQVVFITGGPGRGKTALLTEFARRAMAAHPTLLVATGNCNAYSGLGDAYLPFREVLAMLTGDVEAHWTAGTITRDHTLRLWHAIPLTVQALLDHGPYIVPALVPAVALVFRCVVAGHQNAPWFQRLRERLERQKASSESLEQSHLFQQVTNLLRALAEVRPLLLILDDLQWADTASIGLLFHLGRRFGHAGARILVASAYRPEEVALGRGGERHPLEKALLEFKRTFGDVWVDLTEAEESEERRFVDAFLETESNRLRESFREALFKRAGGHPLFTVELLRAMQERGDLVQDEAGRWIAGPKVNWEALPDRVEGVISERIARLEAELQETLSVASVEGERFTSQVVAQVRKVDKRGLTRQLSQELGKRHRLVREEGIQQVGGNRLYLYRFGHNLIHQHLYNELGVIERDLLHGDIGVALEALFGANAEQIAPQLAFHFSKAGIQDKALYYLIQAGNQARDRYAHQEAIDYYHEALAMVPTQDLQTRFELLLNRDEVHDAQGDRKAQASDLVVLASLADELGDRHKQAEVALRHAQFAEATGDYLAAIDSSERATVLAQECGDLQREAAARNQWGRTLAFQGHLDGARDQLSTALELLRNAPPTAETDESLRVTEAKALNNLAYIFYTRGDYAESRAYLEEALSIHRQVGNRLGESSMLMNLGHIAHEQTDHDSSMVYYEPALRAFREMGHRRSEGMVLQALGNLSEVLGLYNRAADYFRRALTVSRESGDKQVEAFALSGLGFVAEKQGRYSDAIDHHQRGLMILREIGTEQDPIILTGLGDALLGQGDVTQAAEAYQQAINRFQEAGHTAKTMGAKEGLARVALQQGDLARAQDIITDILAYFDECDSILDSSAPQLYLTCYHTLKALNDERASAILQKAHEELQRRAANIGNEHLRRSFLEKVPAHLEIVAEWTAQKKDTLC